MDKAASDIMQHSKLYFDIDNEQSQRESLGLISTRLQIKRVTKKKVCDVN